jgi:hypothetical protein
MYTNNSINAVVINQPSARICSLNIGLRGDWQLDARKNLGHDFTKYQTLALLAEWLLWTCAAVPSAAMVPPCVWDGTAPDVLVYDGTVPVYVWL